MKVLVTGISGFAGSHLAAHLLDAGHDVRGFSRTPPPPRVHSRLPSSAIRLADLRDPTAVREALFDVRPDAVVHLAGIAFAPRANRDPREAYEVNFLAVVGLLEAVRDVVPGARVLLPTSGEVYGRVAEGDLPIRETQALQPLSPYAVGKAAADLVAFQFHWQHGLDVLRARPFNHTGPGQAPDFVCSEFARAVARIEAGKAEPVLRVGNLDVERDFHDVRDTVRAYELLLTKGAAGEVYHVAAGRSVSIRSILERLVAASRVPIRVETDPAKVRRGEVRRIEVSVERIRETTGWVAGTPLDRTLDDLLAWWRTEEAA